MTDTTALAAMSDVTALMVSRATLKVESARRRAQPDTTERNACWVILTIKHKVWEGNTRLLLFYLNQKGYIKLIKCDSNGIYVTKDLYLK